MDFVPYEEKMGKYTLPNGLKEMLSGLSLEEQMPYFFTSEYRTFENSGFSSRTDGGDLTPLADSREVKALITDGGIIVGCMMRNEYGGEEVCFINQCVCTYSTEENNGAGYKYRDDYTYFVVTDDGNKKKG
ncbi:MAG: hypothetical protein J6W28_07960 [Clostridia bacterium]|nr:hypothetical protein [Clostridia bacterium]